VMAYDNWAEDAECVGANPALFDAHTIDGEDPEPSGEYRLRTQVALTYCHDCPVRQKCLDFANEHHMIGVWGGRVFTYQVRRRQAARELAASREQVA
jgi:hypothetical protein